MKWLHDLVYAEKNATIEQLRSECTAMQADLNKERTTRIRAENARDNLQRREEGLQDVILKITNTYQPTDIRKELHTSLALCDEEYLRVQVAAGLPDVRKIDGPSHMQSKVLKIEGRVGFISTELEMSHHLTCELATLLGEYVRDELLRRQGWGV